MAQLVQPGTVAGVIGYLHGTARTTKIVETTCGVGYVVSTVTPMGVGEEVSLHITSVTNRDGVTTLYGFGTETEQRLFEAITAVSGVGGHSALALLRDLGAARLVGALKSKDAKVLTAAKGIGAKAAEKICAMVKLPDGLDTGQLDEGAVAVIEVLRSLGYSNDEAYHAVAASAGGDEVSDEERLALALGHLRERGAR